jgi:hypothetical protein
MFWFGRPKLREILLLAAVLALCAFFAVRYFSAEVFYLNSDVYKRSQVQADGVSIIYNTFQGPDVHVLKRRDHVDVTVGGETHTVKPVQSGERQSYYVEYPDGIRYKVESTNHYLMVYDDKGELAPAGGIYINNKKVLAPGEKLYSASEIVTAAYEHYHEKRGIPLLYVFCNLFFIYSWSLLRYEELQNLHFRISYGLWVQDPEPTDFYYVATMLGACAGMIVSVVLGFRSF